MFGNVIQANVMTRELQCVLTKAQITDVLCWAVEHPDDVYWFKVEEAIAKKKNREKSEVSMMVPAPKPTPKPEEKSGRKLGKYCVAVQWCDGTFYKDLTRTADTKEELLKMRSRDERFVEFFCCETDDETIASLGSNGRPAGR